MNEIINLCIEILKSKEGCGVSSLCGYCPLDLKCRITKKKIDLTKPKWWESCSKIAAEQTIKEIIE